MNLQKRLFSLAGTMVFSSALVAVSGCVPVDNGGPYYGGTSAPPPQYGAGPYYGRGGGWYDAQRRERRELQRERERLEEERTRLERERRRQVFPERRPVPRPTRKPIERCPAGFTPSERKCSPRERSLGCRDMRLPGGLGCVSRKNLKRRKR